MTRIGIKRVYEAAEKTDGCRVLVDKFWPRGIRKSELQYDLWARQLAPSDDLRRWYHADPAARWEEFCRRYTFELRHSAAVHDFVRQLAGAKSVTLLYASRNPAQNHALVLQEFLGQALRRLTTA